MNRLIFLLLFLTFNSYGQKDNKAVFNSLERALINPTIVKSLDLSESNLTQLSADILKLKNLEEIDLSSNGALDLSQAFTLLKEIKTLKVLSLTNAKLKKIPDNVSELSNLEDLDLSENELTSFPEAGKKLRNLKYLSFFDNGISSVSLIKGDLPSLIWIDLCYNKFKIFPVELSYICLLYTSDAADE